MENKATYVCLQSHVVPCQLEWVRSGRWSQSVGLLTCNSGWTWVGGLKWVSTSVKCEWVGGVRRGTQVSGNLIPTLVSTHTHTHTYTHTHTHTQIHTRTHACTHPHPPACTHTRTHAHTHAHTHACMHAHTHARRHAHTQTQTHKHSYISIPSDCIFG